jgi:hypothetical protein
MLTAQQIATLRQHADSGRVSPPDVYLLLSERAVFETRVARLEAECARLQARLEQAEAKLTTVNSILASILAQMG